MKPPKPNPETTKRETREEHPAGLGPGAPGAPQTNPETTKREARKARPAGLGPGAPEGPRGWYSRGYLPHYNNLSTFQSITFRLADSLPKARLREIECELLESSPSKISAERRKLIESWLDAGIGCCALKHPALAALMQETLLKWDGARYRLFAWCIMPNHVHVLLETIADLSKIVGSWKSFTGRWAMRNNAGLGLGIPGPTLWMREYWDRYIRDADHFASVRTYIENNPAAAGLCKHPSDWPWSSATIRSASPGALPETPKTTEILTSS
jgi:REP element-mobilizing transposase RayT